MSKNDELLIKNDELLIKNDEICFQNEELCIQMMDSAGSDLTYSHCNFAHAPVAAFANHMGEVLTFRDCRFKVIFALKLMICS